MSEEIQKSGETESETIEVAVVADQADVECANSDIAVEGQVAGDAVQESAGEESGDSSDLVPVVEALLFAHGEPLGLDRIASVLKCDEVRAESILEALRSELDVRGAGVELTCVASKYQLRTRAQYAKYLRELKAEGPKRLSAPALETLSIVAYRQPIVKSDVEKIRGVDATPTLKTLLERNLVRIVGHQATVGQPALYGTTDEFLKLFGLGSLAELPTLRDLNEVEADPGETDDDSDDDTAEVATAPEQELSA